MAYLKVILVLTIIAVVSLEQTEARPRAFHVGNHIMKRNRHHEETEKHDITGNKTGRRWRQARKHNRRHQNRNLLRSLLEVLEDDYENEAVAEEEYDYESPVIEIRFKRNTAESAETLSLSQNSLLMGSLLRN